MSFIPVYAVIIIAALISLGFFKSPISAIFKFVINSALGFLALIVFNLLGTYVGLYIGINIFNAIIIGALGPFGLMLIAGLSFML